MKFGDLCHITDPSFERSEDFIGIFLGEDISNYPWRNIKFLLLNGRIKVFSFLKSEICKFVEVVHETR